MKPVVVRLPDLDPGDDRVYQLNWCGLVRLDRGRFRIFVRFVSERASAHLDRWIRFSDFPFLILGSRWYRGTMVGKPLGIADITLDSTKIKEVHGLSRHPSDGKLSFDTAYPLSLDRPAAPVLEFEDVAGRRVFLPLTELYRSHYFSTPRVIDSITGGLVAGALSNPSVAAWDINETRWLDEPRGLARIAPAPFLGHHQATCLARTLFFRKGRKSLLKVHEWVMKNFAQQYPNRGSSGTALLPILDLPYYRVTWRASVCPLPNDKDGRPRLLVTHISSFAAPEPFNELEILAQSAPSEREGIDNEGQSSGGEMLDPEMKTPVDDVDEGWDPNHMPVCVEDVIAVDEVARRRVPRLSHSTRPKVAAGPRVVEAIDNCGHGSTDWLGQRGRGVSPLVFSSDDVWPARAPTLNDSFRAVCIALDRVVATYRTAGTTATAQFIPSAHAAYAFAVPASDSERAEKAATFRQYLIAEMCLGGKYIYLMEPERRTLSECFPMGVLWRLEGEAGSGAFGVMTTDIIKDIVRDFESSVRQGRSWTRLPGLRKRVKAVSVKHAPGNPPSESASLGFSDRIAHRVLEACGTLGMSNPGR